MSNPHIQVIHVGNGEEEGGGFFIPYSKFPLAVVHPYTFPLRVIVVKDRSPRHPDFEFLLDVGRMDVERVLDGTRFIRDKLSFFMPERWMSVHEQRSFMSFMSKHPDVGKIKGVTVVTSSAIIISDIPHEVMVIQEYGDGKKFGMLVEGRRSP